MAEQLGWNRTVCRWATMWAELAAELFLAERARCVDAGSATGRYKARYWKAHVFQKERDATRVRALYLSQRIAVNNHLKKPEETLKKLRAARNRGDLAEEGCHRCAGPHYATHPVRNTDPGPHVTQIQ
jgi:hypothetical protein